jgi:hypothetical protein
MPDQHNAKRRQRNGDSARGRAYGAPVGYRFTRDGIEYFGDAPETYADAVTARFSLSDEGQRIADAAATVLDGRLVLCDGRSAKHHLVAGEHRWISAEEPTIDESQLCFVEARINRRWTLYVCARGGLHHDAQRIADWAARKLDAHLPKQAADEPRSPPASGGGSSGSAEAGIPVWWARKARN